MTFCQHKFHSFSQSSSEQSDVAPDSRGAESSSFSHRSQGSVKSNLPKAGSQARSLLTELGKTTLVESQSQSPKRAIVLPGENSATFMYWSCLLAQLV